MKNLLAILLILFNCFNTYQTEVPSEVVVPAKTNTDLPDLDLESALQAENIEDLKLTIYAFSGYEVWRKAPSVEDLKRVYASKVEISGEELAENIDLFYKIKSSNLTPRSTGTKIYCDLFYVLESEKNGVLLEVALWYFTWEDGRTVQVNGVEVKEEQFLYDILLAYLNDEILGWWEPLLDVNYYDKKAD